VPGVIDVTGWGGKTKTYELEVDFNKLMAYGLTLPQLLQTLNNSNINVGGNTVNIGPQVAVVRGVGLIRSMDDLSNTMLTQTGGNPVLVRDVATVTVGYKPRLASPAWTPPTISCRASSSCGAARRARRPSKRVHEEVERINTSDVLPPGVRIERVYDRKA
jgi:cobalt-zinc-cadmium resistance protein CzcA